MNTKTIELQSIGVIRSPHKALSEIPIQPVFCEGIEGRVELDVQYQAGLKGLEGFSHIYLFFSFHESQKTCLKIKPYLSDEEQGIFASRAPHRPNKIGMSLVSLLRVVDNIIHISGVDILDGTPLLDIKPYVRRYDSRENANSGWQDAISDEAVYARGRRNLKR